MDVDGVLGEYDQLLIEDEAPDDQDIVYYVGHNVIERRPLRLPTSPVPALDRAP